MEQEDTKTRRVFVDGSEEVIGACIEVHRVLGPGLLESAYEVSLCHELGLRGLRFVRQRRVPLLYKGVALDCGFVLIETGLLVNFNEPTLVYGLRRLVRGRDFSESTA
jgi:hypothetical protein